MLQLKFSNDKLEIFEEEPSYKLINWYRKEKLYLAMPYMIYYVGRYSVKHRYLETVGMSDSPVNEDPKISPPVLPNTYGWRLCGTGYGYTPKHAITRYWHSSFTNDGKAANHPTWRHLSMISGRSLMGKRSILQWWEENLDLESVLELPYWKENHYLELPHLKHYF